MAGVKGRSGGLRVGSGRKPRQRAADWLAGHPGKRGPKPVERPASVGEAVVTRPNALEEGVREVWDELAPLAIEQGTLTPPTAMAFADLCAYIVLERKLRTAPLAVAGADHRGMIARVDVGRARFRLTPDGKPAAAPEQPKDEFAEFDGPTLVKRA